MRVGHDLEGQRRERLVVGGLALELLVALEVHALGGGQVDRAREVVDDGVEQRLHALVLERGAVEDRDDLAADACRCGWRERRSSTVISSSPTYFSRMFSSKCDSTSISWWRYSSACSLQLGGDLLDLPLGAQLLVEPHERLHGDEVDDALVVALGADRQLDDGDVGVEAILDGVERGEEVGARGGPSC